MNELQKAAEILVESGYANGYTEGSLTSPVAVIVDNGIGVPTRCWQDVDLFSDTLEGRRQRDWIKDWLTINAYGLWLLSEKEAETPKQPYSEFGCFWYQHENNRIRWCLQELSK